MHRTGAHGQEGFVYKLETETRKMCLCDACYSVCCWYLVGCGHLCSSLRSRKSMSKDSYIWFSLNSTPIFNCSVGLTFTICALGYRLIIFEYLVHLFHFKQCTCPHFFIWSKACPNISVAIQNGHVHLSSMCLSASLPLLLALSLLWMQGMQLDLFHASHVCSVLNCILIRANVPFLSHLLTPTNQITKRKGKHKCRFLDQYFYVSSDRR